MRVQNCSTEVIGICTRLTAEASFENVTDERVCPLRQERNAAENWLHRPAESTATLRDDNVEVIGHDRIRDERRTRRRHAIDDCFSDRSADFLDKPWLMPLGAGCDVKNAAGLLLTKHATHGGKLVFLLGAKMDGRAKVKASIVVRETVRETVREFLDDDCTTLAAAISYYTVFALPPLLVLILTTVGLLVDPAEVQGRITREVGSLIGPDAAVMVGTMVEQASRMKSGFAAVLGVLALLFGATGAFIQLQNALNQAWDVPKQKQGGGIRGHLLKRVLSLGMILGIGFLLLVSMLVGALLTAAGDSLAAMLPDYLSGGLLRAMQLLVELVLITVLFAAIFKVLPDIEIGWRDVMIGAAFTALLFTAGKFLLGIYLGTSDPGSSFGAAGALAAILVWIYYSAMILLLGAELTQVWTRRRHPERSTPAPARRTART